MDQHQHQRHQQRQISPWTGGTEPPAWYYDELERERAHNEARKEWAEKKKQEIHHELMRTCEEYRRNHYCNAHFVWAFKKRQQAQELTNMASSVSQGNVSPVWGRDETKYRAELLENAARLRTAAERAEKCASSGGHARQGFCVHDVCIPIDMDTQDLFEEDGV